jgi:hypothetical protein
LPLSAALGVSTTTVRCSGWGLLPLEGSQVAIPFYKERVLCYECYTALDALRFFAKKGDEQAYQWTRQRILQV